MKTSKQKMPCLFDRKETSFLNPEAKPVIRNSDVDVELRAISVSSTHFTSNSDDSNSDSVDSNYYSISGTAKSTCRLSKLVFTKYIRTKPSIFSLIKNLEHKSSSKY